MTVLPFRNSIDVISIRGKFIREALEVSVRDYNPVVAAGRFFQMSGKLHVCGSIRVYNMTFINILVAFGCRYESNL